MKWIKASEQLPKISGEYIVKFTDQFQARRGAEYIYYDSGEGGFMTEHDEYFSMEWLSEDLEPTFERLFQEFIDFSIPTFADATWVSSLDKLQDEELKELRKASKISWDAWMDEYVDCFMCILDSMARAACSTPSIPEFKKHFIRKLIINKERKWVKNKNNTYSHK